MTQRKFKTYILKYIESVPLDDIAEMKRLVDNLDFDCVLQNLGSDNRAYYLCQDIVAGYNKEGAMRSVEYNYPHIPKDKIMLFDMKGRRLQIG